MLGVALTMSTPAIILLATFTAADFARVRVDKAGDKAEELLDAKGVGALETRAIRAVDASTSSGAASTSLESPGVVKPAPSRAIAASAGVAFKSLESPGVAEPALSRAAASSAGAAFASLEDPEGPGVHDSALARAVAALASVGEGSDAFIRAITQDVDQTQLHAALGDSAIAASIAKVDALQAKLGELLKISLVLRQELFEAAGLGNVALVNDLVKQGIDVNLDAETGWVWKSENFTRNRRPTGWVGTPLQHAAKERRPEVVRTLLKAGAEKNLPDEDGKTPLFFSTGEVASPQVARILLEAGADPDLAISTGFTPLHNCARWDHAHIARLLLAADANINAVDEDGETPLFVAAKEGSKEVARILLDAKPGAKAYLGNDLGQTPVNVAKNMEIRKMLELAGNCSSGCLL